MSTIEARLAELGVTLPDAPAPAANYVPFVVVGNLVHISGQISQTAAGLTKGKLGADMTVEAGAEAAKSCAISLLAQLKKACDGDLSRLVRAVKLVGFVNSTADFTDQPKVINGASDFLVAALGDAGRHARSAVSADLPLPPWNCPRRSRRSIQRKCATGIWTSTCSSCSSGVRAEKCFRSFGLRLRCSASLLRCNA